MTDMICCGGVFKVCSAVTIASRTALQYAITILYSYVVYASLLYNVDRSNVKDME